tara:strand:+ start:89 stop:778 length:690 start_codon:yes stop_codon:yes gene_type:complete
MKAILLAAGFGTRLRPLTNSIPKCLVPIKGKPLLEIWLEDLFSAGLNTFLLNTHYLSNQVESFIKKSDFKGMCILKYEENLLGTAGTLLANLNFINNEDCMLIHADNYCQADLNLFIKAHNNRPKHCLMTMMTFQTKNPSSCGIVELDNENVVIDFHEKVDKPPGNQANCAVYILSNEALKRIKQIAENEDLFDFSEQVINKFLGKIFTFQTTNLFIDIGTIENYNKVK